MLRIAASVLISVALGADHAPAASWRFDCGPADSPVAPGYRALTPGHRYSSETGFGWEKGKPSARVVQDLPDLKPFMLYPYMMENLNAALPALSVSRNHP